MFITVVSFYFAGINFSGQMDRDVRSRLNS